jgi:peptidoglycan hydrolase-like protein with peptidoglycan-binding domain
MPSMSRISTRPWAILAAALAVAALCLTAALVIDRRTPSLLVGDVPAQELVVPVNARQVQTSNDVQVRLIATPGDRIRLAAPGLITNVPVKAGVTVKQGDIVVTVQDSPVTAYTAVAPPYRDLAPGARGADVSRLQEFLRALGRYAGEPTGTFDAATSAAARAFNVGRGLASFGARIPAASLIWIGPTERRVATVTATVGDTPGDGVVFVAPAQPLRIEVTEPRGGLSRPAEAKVVVVGAISVPYTAGSGAITDPGSLTKLDSAIGETQVLAKVVGAQPASVMTVPATAVLTDAKGAICVLDADSRRRIVVQPVGGGTTSVDLDPMPTLNRIVVNPSPLPATDSCS